MKPDMIFYRIRRDDGKYSNGGSCPSFGQTGKIWKTIGNVNSHLSCLWKPDRVYRNCTLERLQVVPLAECQMAITGILRQNSERKKARRLRDEWRRITQQMIDLEDQKTQLNKKMLELGAKLK